MVRFRPQSSNNISSWYRSCSILKDWATFSRSALTTSRRGQLRISDERARRNERSRQIAIPNLSIRTAPPSPESSPWRTSVPVSRSALVSERAASIVKKANLASERRLTPSQIDSRSKWSQSIQTRTIRILIVKTAANLKMMFPRSRSAAIFAASASANSGTCAATASWCTRKTVPRSPKRWCRKWHVNRQTEICSCMLRNASNLYTPREM